MNNRILLILTGEHSVNAEESAFSYAKLTSKKLVALQILTSNLYHYGHQDLIATRPSKRQFLLHIRDEILRYGEAQAKVLEEKARQRGVSLEICSIETEDRIKAAISEAKKGYEIIFLPKGKRKLFPLLEKTLAEHLRKKVSSQIVES